MNMYVFRSLIASKCVLHVYHLCVHGCVSITVAYTVEIHVCVCVCVFIQYQELSQVTSAGLNKKLLHHVATHLRLQQLQDFYNKDVKFSAAKCVDPF